MARILVIDDDDFTHVYLKQKISSESCLADFRSHELIFASSAAEGLKILTSGVRPKIDLVLTDLKMPGTSGLELLIEVRKLDLNLPVILITGHGSLETAIEAIRKGANDYVLKPLNITELTLAIERAFRFQKLQQDNKILRTQLRGGPSHSDFIGKSQPIREVLNVAKKVAPTQACVLIQGESGSGKEMLARVIHLQGSQAEGTFRLLNCSTLPSEFLEISKLLKEAQAGTFFLDEISDLDLNGQLNLQKALQELDGKGPRIISSSRKDLLAGVREGRFREDLFYRLSVIPIEIPPLRQRAEDVLPLAEHFLQKYCLFHDCGAKDLVPEAQAKLISVPWYGNVRELENAIERAVILSKSSEILPEDLPDPAQTGDLSNSLVQKAAAFQSLQEVEKHYIDLILRRTGGRKERAAHILGIDRKTLRRKEREYGISLIDHPATRL